MKNITSTIKVAKKSDRPSVSKINKMVTMKKKGVRMDGKKQAVPNITAMKKRKLITSMD